METINFKCETCNYETALKANLGIHLKSKKHCQLVGTPWEGKEAKPVKQDTNDTKQDKDAIIKELQDKLKEQDFMIREMKLQHEIELLNQKNKYQEEMYNRLLADKDTMIQYLMTVKEAPIQVVQAPQPIQVVQSPQVLPQVVPQEAPQVVPQVPQAKAKEDPDDEVLNKSYLQKYCQMDSHNFSKNLEIIDADYELFMSGEYVPMRKVMTQILERELKRITLHDMGVVVLPNDKIYTYIDEWTESSKGLQDIRKSISKQLQTFILEDGNYENMQYVTDDDFEGYKPTLKQAEQYKDATEVILQLQNERHEADKEIKLILKHYSTK